MARSWFRTAIGKQAGGNTIVGTCCQGVSVPVEKFSTQVGVGTWSGAMTK